MRISAKIDYACKALIELSLHWPNKEPLAIGHIAKKQDIPIQFLTQILITLKQLGYTESMRGKKGGYLLSKAPKEIRLDQLIGELGSVGYSMADHQPSKKDSDVMIKIWSELDQMVLNAMAKINFEVICNRKKSLDKIVMFDI